MRLLNLLVDTGFIIALIDPSDPYHEQAQSLGSVFKEYQFYIPWAVLFECLDERFYKRLSPISSVELAQFLFSDQVTFINTSEEENQSALLASKNSLFKNKTTSLTDCVIIELLKDDSYYWNGLLSPNSRDFKFFCDIRQITMLP